MATISGSVPNVIGGLSQQPPAVRLENTATDLKNAIPSVVSGLRKRPPLNFIADLMDSPTGEVASYTMDRPGKPLKFVKVTDGTIRVFNEDGTEEPVTIENGAGYLSAVNTQRAIGFTPIADTLFVYNRAVTVATANDTDTRTDPKTQVTFITEADFASSTHTISVFADDLSVIQKGEFTNDEEPNSVENVMGQLVDSFASAGSLPVLRDGNVSYVYGPDVANRRFKYSPSNFGRGYKDRINRFTNLPPIERNGRLVKVQGDPNELDSAYWVAYDADSRVWEEAAGYNALEKFVASTMPHTLRDNGDGTWTFGRHEWAGRKAGDAESNPTPSFVGNTIKSMFVMANRLCILSDENLIASEVGEFENFYRTTCTSLIDSDRLDIAALTTDSRVSELYHPVEFDSSVLLFSDKSQFRVDISNGLSPNTVNIQPTTAFQATRRCSPVRLGSKVLFVDDADNNEWADVREYLVDAVIGTEDSELITKQVPELIPSGVYKIVTNPSLGLAVVLTRGKTDRIYVYSTYWSGSKRVQSAWAYWDFDGSEVVDAEFVGNSLYLTMNRFGSLSVSRVDLQETLEGDVDGLEIMLDYRVDTPPCARVGDDTIVTMPYKLDPSVDYVVVAYGGKLAGGLALTASNVDTYELTFSNVNLTATSFYVGRKYEFLYELSPIYLRDQGDVPIQDNRFQLRYLSFMYHQSSYFQVHVTPEGRKTYVNTFNGRILGQFGNTWGEIPVDDGVYRVPVGGQPSKTKIVVTNDSPFTCRFSSIEWEGNWRPRTKRMR